MSVQLWYQWAPTVLLLGRPDNASPILPSASFHTFLVVWREDGGCIQEFSKILFIIIIIIITITIIIHHHYHNFFVCLIFLDKVPMTNALPE